MVAEASSKDESLGIMSWAADEESVPSAETLRGITCDHRRVRSASGSHMLLSPKFHLSSDTRVRIHRESGRQRNSRARHGKATTVDELLPHHTPNGAVGSVV